MKSLSFRACSILALLTASGIAQAQDGLIVGVDNAAEPVYLRTAGQWRSLFDGVEAWGLAGDNSSCTLYISAGFELYRFRRGDSSPTLVGPFTDTVTQSNISIQGLLWSNGALYGTRTTSSGGVVEGFYQINVANGDCQLVLATSLDLDLSGCDTDPATGTIYALSDTSALNPAAPGLYRVTFDQNPPVRLADYRAAAQWPGRGSTADVDGLAVGDGRAFMIVDEPGEFAVYNLATSAYETNLDSPWTTSNTFSAVAWTPCFTRPGCIADVDDGTGTGTPDGGVTIDDLIYYLGIYSDGNSAADVDDGTGTGVPDGGVTIDDLLYFLFRYGEGC